MSETDLGAIAARTQAIYERNAERFDNERGRLLIERPWLDRFCALVPAGGSVLDLGCGAGDPIARYLIAKGLAVTGADFSEPMLAIARRRFPQARWLFADMRTLNLSETFDGIVGWHSFFHLRQHEQRDVLKRLSEHLRPGGAMMLTVGPSAGEVTGHVGDDVVYHSSLAPEEYTALLAAQDIETVAFVAEDPACDGSTILLARKKPQA